MSRALAELLGFSADIEDLWKNYYCIATNYSQAREQPLRSGSLPKALLASTAIPGALPPAILDGDLLCDGGTFNNFPVDVMRNLRGVGTVIGVDLNFKKSRRMDLRRGARHLGPAARPPAAAQAAALQVAVDGRRTC